VAFDPSEFVKLARRIASSVLQESELRTAVGRAYYGLFLVARDKMRVKKRRDVHSETIKRLRKVSGYRSTADELDELFELRKVADYELRPRKRKHRNWQRNWSRAEQLANRIHPRLQKLK
jgi:uncharacterized protein (UPF0332 family)